jgi:ubiquinone/menaquinone biosynthesis C-methylase UbiE
VQSEKQMSETNYVLGTNDAEIARLGLQHRVWLPYAAAAWGRAGFAQGQTIIDLGSGPGYVSLELAKIVGPGGRVVAVERSQRFLSHLESERSRLGLAQIETVQADLDDLVSLDVQADGLWCRWVCAFVRHPGELVARFRGMMKSGGAAVFHEYSEYRTWRLLPDSDELNYFVDRVIEVWRADGGEPDVGRSLPHWLEHSGFNVEVVRPIVEVLTPADPMWAWPRAFIESGSERLRSLGVFDADRAQRIRAAFTEAETVPGVRLITPTVLEVIARAQ